MSSLSLRDPAVVAFVPVSFVPGESVVPIPVWDSPECRALATSRAYRAARASGKPWRRAMALAVLAALEFHRDPLEIVWPSYSDFDIL
jgi:hypothetical protein